MNRLTEKAQEALASAQASAVQSGHQRVDVEHLLAALLEDPEGIALSLISAVGIPPENLKRRLNQELERLPKVSSELGEPSEVYATSRLGKVLAQAEAEAKSFKDDYVSIEHLLLAMIGDSGPTGRLLKEFGLTKDRLLEFIKKIRGNQRVTSPNPEGTYQALEKYGRDLTRDAASGKRVRRQFEAIIPRRAQETRLARRYFVW